MAGPDKLLGSVHSASEDGMEDDLESSMQGSAPDAIDDAAARNANREALRRLGNDLLLDQPCPPYNPAPVPPGTPPWQLQPHQQYHQPAGEVLTIIGIEDDLSTIANDTMNGSYFNGQMADRTVPVNPPLLIQKKERRRTNKNIKNGTPEKYPSNHGGSRSPKNNPHPEDDVTLPETPPPPGHASPRSINNYSRSREQALYPNTHKQEYPRFLSSRLGRMTLAASILGFILVGAIGLLSFSLFEMRRIDDPLVSSSESPPKKTNDWGEEKEPEIPLIVGTRSPVMTTMTQPPMASPTPPPTMAEKQPFNRTEFQEIVRSLKEIILQESPEAAVFLNDTDSSSSTNDSTVISVSYPYLALEWLAADPQLDSYTQARILQRWVLAAFFLGITEPATTTNTIESDQEKQEKEDDNIPRSLLRRRRRSLLPMAGFSSASNWMTYTHECNWYSTNPALSCRMDQTIRGIHLEDIGLQGTLPKELSLLSNSLEFIYLSHNNIVGSIPTEYGKLTKLERIQMVESGVSGSIPSELGSLTKLGVLGLGRNELFGVVPPELGALSHLATLGLGANNLSGTIPTELGSLTNLGFLSLSSNNNLFGLIPTELGACTRLSTLLLTNTRLESQDMPPGICDIGTFERLEVDCEIGCTCCTDYDCSAPTATPVSPVITATPTVASTSSGTTVTPTAAPTTLGITLPPNSVSPTVEECVSHITPGKSCYTSAEAMELDLVICDFKQFDLLAMYEASTTEFEYNDAVFWLRSCGAEHCHGRVEDDFLTFDNKQPVRLGSPWPLPKGDYKFNLIRVSAGAQLISHAESKVFRIKETCPQEPKPSGPP